MSARRQGERAGTPAPGERVGPYRVAELLGEGGMARVYRAQAPDGCEVALKCVKGEHADDETFRRRFEREARAAARVQHRHLVAVLDAGEHAGVPYLAQQLIRGGTLADRIDRHGPLPLAAAMGLCGEVAAGLEALHAARLVHRDLKPGNILLDERGAAHITDFGLAKLHDASLLTRPGQAVGSIDYMAPEQIRGQEVTARTDVYALGCVLYECLAGRAPFADRQGMRVLWAHMRDEPTDPCAARDDAPRDLGFAVTRALAKEPAERPATATAYARIVQIAAGTMQNLGGNS